jgi:hypothetical protein
MDEPTIDPYGGFQESWPSDLLDASSQRSNLVFTDRVVRSMPRIDQITFPDAAHFEICGYDIIACCAYSTGHTDDAVGTLRDLLADGRYLGYHPERGSNTTQLATLCGRRGWPVTQDISPAGQLGLRLEATHQVACMALNTHYGTGSLWNVLHPEAGGNVGHYEGGGDVTGGYVVDAAKEEGMAQKDAWTIFEGVLGRIADPDSFAWALGQARVNPVTLLWAVIQGEEFTKGGGLLGRIASLQAQVDALKAGLTGATVDSAGEAAQNAHMAAVDAAVQAINAKFGGIAKALTPQ